MNKLTQDHQIFITKKMEEGFTDYVLITQLMLDSQEITGRSKEAKLVRDFMISSGGLSKEKKATKPLEEQVLLRDLQEMEEELFSYQQENQTLLDLISCISLEPKAKKTKVKV